MLKTRFEMTAKSVLMRPYGLCSHLPPSLCYVTGLSTIFIEVTIANFCQTAYFALREFGFVYYWAKEKI